MKYLLFLFLFFASSVILAKEIDFVIPVPVDLSLRSSLTPTKEEMHRINSALKRVEKCEVLRGDKNRALLGYAYDCFIPNYLIFLSVLATSISIFSAYEESYIDAKKNCDTFNMRKNKDEHDPNMLFRYKNSKIYGYEKSCIDSFLKMTRYNVEKVYFSRCEGGM